MNIRHGEWSAGGVGLQNRLLDEKVWAIKFLKAVRLDASDSLVYSQEGAAREGEWVVSGGYAVCDPKSVTHRTPNCHCLTSFVGVVSCGRCTIAEVVEMDKFEYQQVIERLVRHFVDDLGAPTSVSPAPLPKRKPPIPPSCATASAPECGSRLSALPAVTASTNITRCSSS